MTNLCQKVRAMNSVYKDFILRTNRNGIQFKILKIVIQTSWEKNLLKMLKVL